MKVSFNGYRSVLKTMWRKGELPKVKRGLYGESLTQDTISIEHLIPVSKGGRLILANEALADRYLNSLRGTRNLREFLTKKQGIDYINQFVGDKRLIIQRYIEGFCQTLRKLRIF